jgi:UDP-N-acetylmuramoyl-L-alanyl-D-glutamate--2,6-diaminopimelate ligase
VGSRVVAAPMTTPGADDLQKYFWEMANAGCKSAVMEVSSHSLVQQRVRNIRFAAGLFTNITRDHLDYHKTHEEYRAAKGLLFESLSSKAVAALNADDPASLVYAANTKARVVGFGMVKPAPIGATIEQVTFNGTKFRLRMGSEELPVVSRLIGRHNVYNMLGAAATCWAMGYDLEAIKGGLENLTAVPGRLESVDCGQDFSVLVDYAHTDDALKNVLTCLRPLLRGRLHVVFGCGGDRDKGKRPKMGRVAEELADSLIITSDNPRSEEPLDIIRDITVGIQSKTKYLIEPDRRAAIKLAISMAKKDDAVLIAGKGHENYQIFRDGTHPFDDRQVAREILGEMTGHLKK